MYAELKGDPFSPKPRPWPGAEPLWLNRLRTHLVGRLSNRHHPGDKPDIFAFSPPRSGSTFVLEIMAREPGLKVINEPLNINRPTTRRALGVSDWAEATRLTQREARYARYIQALRANRLGALNAPFYRDDRRTRTDRLFLKILHGGEDMVPWFEQSLGGQILVLLRHPIPTVQSHWHFPRLTSYLDQPGLTRHLTDRQMTRARKLLDERDLFACAILDWCFQTFLMAHADIPDTWTRISYEELVLDPDGALAYLRERLHLTGRFDAQDISTTPSRTVIRRDAATRAHIEQGDRDSKRYLIDRWQEKVSQDQIDLAFDLLSLFGIDYYQAGSSLPPPAYRQVATAEPA